MADYSLQINNVSKTYEDGEGVNQVLYNVSLKVKSGELVAIVGPSGSGKTTLLSIAGALLTPNEGNVIIGDTAVSSENKKDWTKIRREQIGFIFQSHQLIPFLTIKEQLAIMGKISKNGKTSDYTSSLLDDLGLIKRLRAYPKQLSGGEKQRVAIARAFVNNPDIILADEPTASLDGERGRQVAELIKTETKKHGKAAVIVTHDERILDLVDKVYHIENGRLF